MDIPPGREQDMVSQEIDRKGATWDGVDAPTQGDIQRLQAQPTDTMVESFDEQFGEGSAAKYMNEGEGGEEKGEGDSDTPAEEASEKY
jgi:hypothetical protein